MKQLRNAIMRSFVLYFLGLSITGGLIEEFFNQLEELFLGNRYQISVQLVSGLFQIFAVIGFSILSQLKQKNWQRKPETGQRTEYLVCEYRS